MRRARVEHGFREFFEFLLGGKIELRPRERVVDDANRISVAALKSPADVAQPGHVHARGDEGEVG